MKHFLDHIWYYMISYISYIILYNISYHIYHIREASDGWSDQDIASQLFFCDLNAPEVMFPSTRNHIMAYSMYDIACPASTSARWPTCWGAPPSFSISGDSNSTIPYCSKDDRRIGHASANTQRDQSNGSRLYKVNIWMWCYGRGRSRMVSVTEAERIRT